MRLLFATSALACLAITAHGAEQGFVPLFDGTLNGWKLVGGKGRGYVVENGVLVCPADGGGNLFTEKEYANFVLRFEFKLSPGGNNGVGIRAPLEGQALTKGWKFRFSTMRTRNTRAGSSRRNITGPSMM
jgi:hypothetical protein